MVNIEGNKRSHQAENKERTKEEKQDKIGALVCFYKAEVAQELRNVQIEQKYGANGAYKPWLFLDYV